MGKIKGKKGVHKNKEACEFILVNRGMDDPNFENPNASKKVLLHVPKESDNLNKKHEKILNQIPDLSRGLNDDEAIGNNLKELGVELRNNNNQDEIRKHLNEINKENLVKKVNIDLTRNEILRFEKNSKLKSFSEEVEEIVDTCLPDKNVKNLQKKETNNGSKSLDEKNIDEILKSAKISAEITEYNKYGLRKDIDPEVLDYVTDKEFVEGVDIFIPASGKFEIEQNRFDIDIPPEKMDENYKEVYEALQNEEEGDVYEELEDNFVLLANDGVAPIELLKEEKGKIHLILN
jgi:hypothetical protein